MKRTVSILLALVLVFCLSVTAFAATVKETELLGAVDAKGNDAAASVTLTSFAKREELPEEDLAKYEGAVATVISSFEAAVKSGKIKAAEGSYAFLYDTLYVSVAEAEGLELPYTLDITKPDGFLALMVNLDGAWDVVASGLADDAVRFAAESNQTIALVCQTGSAPTPTPVPTEQPAPVPPSSENNAAPTLNGATGADGEDADDALSIISFKERDDLNKVYEDDFALAYKDLAEGFDKILEGDEKLKAAAGENNVAVSDTFFVSADDVSKLDYPIAIEIELAKFGAENPDEFVALMQWLDGEWQFIESSVADGVVSASINEIGPFAIVVVAAE